MCKYICFLPDCFKDSKWTQGCELDQAGYSSCTVLIVYSNTSESKKRSLDHKGSPQWAARMFDLTDFLNVGCPLWGKPEMTWTSSRDRTDNL